MSLAPKLVLPIDLTEHRKWNVPARKWFDLIFFRRWNHLEKGDRDFWITNTKRSPFIFSSWLCFIFDFFTGRGTRNNVFDCLSPLDLFMAYGLGNSQCWMGDKMQTLSVWEHQLSNKESGSLDKCAIYYFISYK